MKKAYALSKVSCYLFVVINWLNYAQGSNHYRPHISHHFTGELVEGERKVSLVPPLTASDKDAPQLSGLICEYQIFFTNHTIAQNLFHVVVLNKRTGEAEIELVPNISLSLCNDQVEYDFLIQAVDCGSFVDENGIFVNRRSSKNSKLHILLKEENIHAPYFSKTSHVIKVEESISQNQVLLHLEAKDDDCSNAFGNICMYQVDEESNGIFSVMDDGTLISLMEFNANQDIVSLNTSVVAYDCGGRKSYPAWITIHISPPCYAGVSGFSEALEFIAFKTFVPLAALPSLNTCVSPRDILSMSITVSLDISDVETITGCDHEISSGENERKFCEATDQQLYELLPSSLQHEKLDRKASENPSLVKYRLDSGKRVYGFNGLNQVFEIIDPEISQVLTLHNFSHPFSIYFNFFLFKRNNKDKQTILCKADGQGLNRHHFAIYIQNCHIMLLLRLQHGYGLNPAEWHWKLNDGNNCSEQWYQVLIQINYPEASLYVNGKKLTPFLIADDRLLHPIFGAPKWSVGAAWGGRRGEYEQYFQGQLSSLLIYLDRLDDVETLQCAGRCTEGVKLMEGTDDNHVTSLSQFSLQIQSNGDGLSDLMKTLQQVQYFNNDRSPIPGLRSINIETNLTCLASSLKCPVFPLLRTSVMVVSPPDPGITLSGKGELTLQLNDVKGHDFRPFDDLSISLQAKQSGENATTFDVHKLESCVVNVTGDNRPVKLRIRAKVLIRKNGLLVKRRYGGLTIRGLQQLELYEKLLHSLVYQKSYVKDFENDIIFSLRCYTSNKKFFSNLYTLTVTFSQTVDEFYPAEIPEINPLLLETPATPAGMKAVRLLQINEAQEADFVAAKFKALRKNGHDGGNVAAMVVGGSAGVVILFVLVLVIARFQGCIAEEDRDEDLVKEAEEDLDWDDSAMTITVNPMNEEEIGDASDADFSEIEDEDFSFVSDHDEHHVSRDQSPSRRDI